MNISIPKTLKISIPKTFVKSFMFTVLKKLVSSSIATTSLYMHVLHALNADLILMALRQKTRTFYGQADQKR